MFQIFLADGHTGQSEVVQEVLSDLKKLDYFVSLPISHKDNSISSVALISMAGWWEGRGSAVGKSAKSLAKPQLFVLHGPEINQLPKTTFHTCKVVTILDCSLRKV